MIEENEEMEAFKLFSRGVPPNKVKIELNLPAEKAARHYLAFMKSVALVDLFPICDDLGDYLPDFVEFYKSAKTYNITPHNMAYCLELAANTSFLQQENSNTQSILEETRKFVEMEKAKLFGIRGDIANAQDANVLLVRKGEALQSEVHLLNSVLDKIKNSPDYQILNRLISDSVNSITSEQTFALQVCLIAIIKLCQQDPTLIPFFQFPVPGDCDTSAQTAMYQAILINLITETTKIMPNVLDELATLTKKKYYQKSRILKRSLPQALNSFNKTMTNRESLQNWMLIPMF